MIAADNEMGKGVLNIPLRGLEILNRGGVPSYSPIEIEKRNLNLKCIYILFHKEIWILQDGVKIRYGNNM